MKIKFIIIFLGIALFIAISIFTYKIKEHFIFNSKVVEKLNTLKQLEYKLDYDVLSDSIFFYFNNDKIIYDIKSLKKIMCNLYKNEEFKEEYPKTYDEFLKYRKFMTNKIKNIYHFQTLNSPIKNSLIYLGSLSEKMLKENHKIGEKAVSLTISLYQSKNSLDYFLINNKDLEIIKKSNCKYKNVFLNHFKVFDDYFSFYTKVLNDVLTESNIDLVIKNIFNESKAYIKIFTLLSLFLLSFVLSVIILIIYLFYKLDLSYKIDSLTGLYNRNKFNEDVKKLKSPVLILFNIDKFKSYNDVFGTKIGDEILKEVAKQLLKFNKKVYRIGADDFGILLEEGEDMPEVFALRVVEHFQNSSLKVDNLEFNISFSVGISDKKPLLETADMVLKHIKRDVNIRIKKYSPDLNLEKEVKENLAKATILREAIEKGNIVPVFQPIVDLETNEIEKYEVLARVRREDGSLESIFPYLKVSKENKLYEYISQTIFKEAFKVIDEKKINLSLNISIDDLLNKKFMSFVYDNLPKYSKYLTFEILESDAIEDYSLLENFIIDVKRYGAKIAIDDFGSGYSNFARILALNVDLIKIDGSLIKNIDHDNQSKLISEMIVDFCRKTDIKILAEYVHNDKVLEVIKELKINYGQGFYLGKPMPLN